MSLVHVLGGAAGMLVFLILFAKLMGRWGADSVMPYRIQYEWNNTVRTENGEATVIEVTENYIRIRRWPEADFDRPNLCIPASQIVRFEYGDELDVSEHFVPEGPSPTVNGDDEEKEPHVG